MTTTERVLRLLGLLQRRPVWSGSELAEELGVTTRSIRRDIGRLRELGYPVRAAHGAGGGYQLGSGQALPPLLLDDEEAVAVAVSLRLAAGGTVAGASEAALRTLAKLDQVMPPRLRSEVRAIQDATVTLLGPAGQVDGEALLVLARACRDRLRVRFDYRPRQGEPSARYAEPVRLVATERRWYLMAFDLDRQDWRSFRLDRIAAVRPTTWRFTPREHPDPVRWVQRAVTTAPYRHRARIRVHAEAATVRDLVPPTVGTITAVGGEALLEAGADDLEWLALHVARLGLEVTIEEPVELAEVMREMAARLERGASRAAGQAG